LERRITKRVNGAITEKYLWKDAITLLTVYDANNNLIMRFTYADGRMPISMIYNGSTYYLTYDQIGSLRAVIDTSANIIKRIDYDSFGSIISDTNPGMNIPLGFAGGLHDRDTNLVRFGVRDYDPTLGRWTAKDPIDFAGDDNNLYRYVFSDPQNQIDLLGLYPGPCGNANHTWVPDYPFNFDFTGPCKAHDDCYDCKGGKSKAQCDLEFLWNMAKACFKSTIFSVVSSHSLTSSTICAEIALTYYIAVSRGGYNDFKAARKGCYSR